MSVLFIVFIYLYMMICHMYSYVSFTGNLILGGDINPCLFARGIYTMFLIDATPMLGWSDYLRSKRRRDVFLFSDVKETVTFL